MVIFQRIFDSLCRRRRSAFSSRIGTSALSKKGLRSFAVLGEETGKEGRKERHPVKLPPIKNEMKKLPRASPASLSAFGLLGRRRRLYRRKTDGVGGWGEKPVTFTQTHAAHPSENFNWEWQNWSRGKPSSGRAGGHRTGSPSLQQFES